MPPYSRISAQFTDGARRRCSELSRRVDWVLRRLRRAGTGAGRPLPDRYKELVALLEGTGIVPACIEILHRTYSKFRELAAH